ncbi:MAG: hypothetical protein AAF409_16065 [Pseudomonadota bacterium]
MSRFALRQVLLLIAAVTLAGCVQPPANTLSPSERAGLQVSEVAIEFAPDHTIWWGSAEREYGEANGCSQNSEECDFTAFIETEEVKSHLRERVESLVNELASSRLLQLWGGEREVTARVRIKRFYVVSGAQSVLLGGAHSFVADLEIIDPENAGVLTRYPDLLGTAGYAPGGLLAVVVEAASDDASRRIVAEWSNAAVSWLNQTPE